MEAIDLFSQQAVETYLSNAEDRKNNTAWFTKRLVLIGSGNNQYLECCYSWVVPIRRLWAMIFESGSSLSFVDIAVFLSGKEYKNEGFRTNFTEYCEGARGCMLLPRIGHTVTDTQYDKIMNVASATHLSPVELAYLRRNRPSHWTPFSPVELAYLRRNRPSHWTPFAYLGHIQALSREEREFLFTIDDPNAIDDELSTIRRILSSTQNEKEGRLDAIKAYKLAVQHGFLWQFVGEIPSGQKEFVLRYCVDVSEKTHNSRREIVEALRQIPQDQWMSVITHLKFFELEGLQLDEFQRLVRTMAEIPQARRGFVTKYPHLLNMEGLSPEQKTKRFLELRFILPPFLKLIEGIPEEELEDVMRVGEFPQIDSFIGFDLVWLADIYNAISRIPREKRERVIPICRELSISSQFKSNLLNELSNIPWEEWDEYLKSITPLLPILYQYHVKRPFFFLYLLPLELRTEECLKNWRIDLKYVLAQRASLEQKMTSTLTSPQLLVRLAQYGYDHKNYLQLVEEEPLFQQVLEIMIAKEFEGEKNAFSLYKKLQRMAHEPVDSLLYETRFSVPKLQASVQAFQVRRSELPKGATVEAWDHVIATFKEKIETDEEAKSSLQLQFADWESLWNSSLSDYYFSSLLKITEERVSIVEAQFRAILHHLLSKEKSVPPQKFFSEQEEVLIKLAMSIQHCSGGKKEGIALGYAQLPDFFKYRAQGLKEGLPEEIQAKEFVAEVLQKALLDQFSGSNALMQELTGAQVVGQAPHQAIYLKNLIGPVVGLRHDLTFDKHTGLLYDSLVQKSRNEVLQIFFRHFTPELVGQELVRVVNSDFRKNNNIIRHLVKEGMDGGWDWDEETWVPVRLNEQGALQILEAAGFSISH